MMRIIFFAVCCMISAAHLNAQTEHELLRNKSIEVAVSDLVICEDAILVNVAGALYMVKSLEKKDDRWTAIIDADYCPRGHPLCRRCGLCHVSGCWYYVDPYEVHR